jgi:hypothetical protein
MDGLDKNQQAVSGCYNHVLTTNQSKIIFSTQKSR